MTTQHALTRRLMDQAPDHRASGLANQLATNGDHKPVYKLGGQHLAEAEVEAAKAVMALRNIDGLARFAYASRSEIIDDAISNAQTYHAGNPAAYSEVLDSTADILAIHRNGVNEILARGISRQCDILERTVTPEKTEPWWEKLW